MAVTFDEVMKDGQVLIQALESTAQRIANLHERFGQVRGEIEASKGEVEQSFGELQNQVGIWSQMLEQLGGQVGEVVQQLGSSAQGATEQASAADQSLADALEQLRSVLPDFQSATESGRAAIQESAQRVQEISQAGREGSRATQEKVSQDFETSMSELASTVDAIEAAQGELEEMANETVSGLDTQSTESERIVSEQLTQASSEQIEEFGAGVQSIADELVANEIQQLSESGEAGLNDHVKAPFDEMLTFVQQEVEKLVQEITNASQGSVSVRDVMKPIVQELDVLVQPVEDTVAAVKKICETVGL